MSWTKHIYQWAKNNNREAQKVEGILLRNGWNPEYYSSTMKTDLFRWLDAWYTLSIKNLPKPSTLRANPMSSNTDCIITLPCERGYLTYRFDYNLKEASELQFNSKLSSAMRYHNSL